MYKITINYRLGKKECVEEVYTKDYYFEAVHEYNTQLDNWLDRICPHINFSTFYREIQVERISSNDEINKKKKELKLMLIKDMLTYMDTFDEYLSGKKTTEETKRKFEITFEEIKINKNKKYIKKNI